MSSADSFPSSNPPAQWEALENRINLLLDNALKLKTSNSQLQDEIANLRAKLRDAEASSNGSFEEMSKLRGSNNQMEREVSELKTRIREMESSSNGSSEELQNLRQKHGQALLDLKQVQENLQRIEQLAVRLHLTDDILSSEKTS